MDYLRWIWAIGKANAGNCKAMLLCSRTAIIFLSFWILSKTKISFVHHRCRSVVIRRFSLQPIYLCCYHKSKSSTTENISRATRSTQAQYTHQVNATFILLPSQQSPSQNPFSLSSEYSYLLDDLWVMCKCPSMDRRLVKPRDRQTMQIYSFFHGTPVSTVMNLCIESLWSFKSVIRTQVFILFIFCSFKDDQNQRLELAHDFSLTNSTINTWGRAKIVLSFHWPTVVKDHWRSSTRFSFASPFHWQGSDIRPRVVIELHSRPTLSSTSKSTQVTWVANRESIRATVLDQTDLAKAFDSMKQRKEITPLHSLIVANESDEREENNLNDGERDAVRHVSRKDDTDTYLMAECCALFCQRWC